VGIGPEQDYLCQTHDVQGEADIHAFFLSHQESVGLAVWQTNGLIAIAKRPGKDANILPPHLCQFSRPEVIPKGIVAGIGNSRVKANLIQLPTLRPAKRGRQRRNLVVWLIVTKSVFRGVKKILAVNEGDSAFNVWLH
jgi:hypothetical protein